MFEALKVIELANVLAGPATGLFFAEMGAEVIKVEHPDGGDITRKWKLPTEDPESSVSAYYCSVNWHKKVVQPDLRTDAGRQEVYDLVKEADVVIANYKPGDDIKLGMDYATLKAINPNLIYAHLTGFGANDQRTAFDVVLQAETGFMSMNGNPESGPVKMPVALIDVLAAHQMKAGILTALIKKMKTGEGSYVSVSLYESAVAALANQASNYLMAGHIPQRMGSLHPNIAPYGEIFQTKDQQSIVLACGTDKQFANLCAVLNLPELIHDERFSTNPARVIHRSALANLLQPAFQQQDLETVLTALHEAKVPVGAIRDMAGVFAEPMAREMVLEETIEDGTPTKRVKTVAFRFQ